MVREVAKGTREELLIHMVMDIFISVLEVVSLVGFKIELVIYIMYA